MYISGDEYCQCCTGNTHELCKTCSGLRHYKDPSYYNVSINIVHRYKAHIDFYNLPPTLRKLQYYSYFNCIRLMTYRITNLPYYLILFNIYAADNILSLLISNKNNTYTRVSQFYKIRMYRPIDFISQCNYNYIKMELQRYSYANTRHRALSLSYYISRMCEVYNNSEYNYGILCDYMPIALTYAVYAQSDTYFIDFNDNLPVLLLNIKHVPYYEQTKISMRYNINIGSLMDMLLPTQKRIRMAARNLPLQYRSAENN